MNCFMSCDELFHVQQFLLFSSHVTCFACFYTASPYLQILSNKKQSKANKQTNESNKQTKHMTKQTKTSEQTNIKQTNPTKH